MKFGIENAYLGVFLASLASCLMKTAIPCTIFIGQAIFMPH